MAIEVRLKIFKDFWSSTTHFVGFLAAIVGAVVLLVRTMDQPERAVGMGLYGAGLVGLFLASSLYHFLDLGERLNHWLQRVDHAAIFLFIAVCFVPPTLYLLQGDTRVALLAVVGALGLAGAVFKLVWFKAPLWADMTGYLGLGWFGLVLVWRIWEAMPGLSLFWYLGGGLMYTAGAVVFILERPDPWPRLFGHHEIWHLFVLGGAFSHYLFTYSLIDATPLG